jgi:hypothetical protein
MVSCDFAGLFNQDKDTTDGGAPIDGRSYLAACNLNNAEFDIDNVTVEFMYGYDYNGHNYPVFDICFVYGDNEVVVKQVEESFNSEKYRCELIYDDELNKIIRVEYNHSENITIPKEVFTNDSGQIMFGIYAVSENYPECGRRLIAATTISYEKINEKVILTEENKKFEAVKVGN